MFGLKITQTNGISELVSDTNTIKLVFAAQTPVGSLIQPLRITEVNYSHLVATVLTYVTVTGIAAYTGANVLYEYGELTEAGTFRVIAANR